jgi:energy-coupling factor transport system ATP-binding protein
MDCIVIKELSYRYPTGTRKALKKVNLIVKKGEFIAVLGKNGSGKTTLCNAIRGFVPHFYNGDISGEIYVNGKNVLESTIGELTLDAGYVFQNPFTQISGAKNTVFEEIGFGLENLGMDRHLIIEKVQAVTKLLGIENLQFKKPSELSGGQKQRVCFAAIIVMEPEILILDEPTSQLDPKGTTDVFNIIQIMKEQGKTIILVEHKINEIAEYADRVVFMDSGKIILDGPTGEVLTNPIMAEYNANIPQYTVLGLEMKNKGYTLTEIPTTFSSASRIIASALGKG